MIWNDICVFLRDIYLLCAIVSRLKRPSTHREITENKHYIVYTIWYQNPLHLYDNITQLFDIPFFFFPIFLLTQIFMYIKYYRGLLYMCRKTILYIRVDDKN
jgi:hypothetical protein